ncbi:PAS domain S-box protein [Arcicella rosea]|uniref:histidine kinase n=1 Tax=Arcicella rosea TaxID=502909 RepID=A0A841ESG1_9BACT|nr:PAS domain S-box protein [Arcicella rosea]MBB6004339.1 PAS domain S-box-containing protein [Arcicella rosea]
MENTSTKNQNIEKSIDSSPIAMFQLVLSADGSISFLYISKDIEHIFFKADKTSFLSNPTLYLESIFQEDYHDFFTTLQTSQKEQSNWFYEFRIKEHEHNFRWIKVFANPENNVDGSTIWHGYFKDISTRKAKDESYKMIEKRFSTIIENFTEGFALIDTEGTILEISTSGKKILGFYNDENTSTIKAKLKIHPEDKAALGNLFLEVIDNQYQAKTIEFRIIMPDGSEKWLETTIHNFLENQAIKTVLLNFRDINEQVLARKQREFDARNLKSLIDNTSDIVWSVDTSFRLISFNTAYEKLIFDYIQESIYPGKNMLETLTFSQTHLALFTSYYKRAFEGETFTAQYNITYLKNLWREVSFYPIKLDGKVIGTACYGKDITERKLNEVALQKTNEQLLAAQSIAKLGYWEVDLVGENHFWSEEMYYIFELDFTQSPLNLADAIKYVHEEDREKLLEQHQLMMTENKYLNLDFRLKMPNGQIKYLVMDARLHKDENGKDIQIRITSQDITIKKKVENDVIQREKRLKAFFEKSTEGIAIVNADKKIIDISPVGKKIFGINTLEEYDKNLVHPDDLIGLRLAFQQVYEQPDSSPTASFRYIKTNGELLWIETHFNNQLTEPSIQGIIMNFMDITKRKKAEQLLKSEQYLLRTIIDNLPLNVYVKDLASRKTLINKAELEYLGFKDEKEGIGKSDYETFTAEYAKIFIEEDQTVFNTGEAIINKETLIEDPTKRRVWYLLSKIPLVNEQGKIDRLIGISIDITEQKLVQEQLIASELMFKNLAKSVPGVVYQLCIEADGTTHFPYLSAKIQEIFGIDFDNNARDLAKYIYSEDKTTFLNSVYLSMVSRSNWNYEGRILTDNGELKWFQGISSPTFLGDKIIFNGILIDITERKNAEESKKHLRQLELSLEKEKEINLLKSRFISFASHEFRTPLATIVTSIDILGIYINMLSDVETKEKLKHHLNRVTSQANRLTEMLSDVLLLEKSANDKINLELEYLDITSLIKDINNQYYHDRKDNRKLELVLPEENKEIYSDASLLKHIINNLIDNAFKYSTNAPNPSLSLEVNDQDFKIIIQDYGIGIPPEDQKHLFEIFFRANNVLNIDGTGLGLNITKEFTHKLGGTISFKSEIGKGTIFTLVFPKQYH